MRAATATAALLAANRGRATQAQSGWQPVDPAGAGLLTMPALVGGRAVRAAIDTASSRTVVDKTLADAIGFERRGDASATGLAGPIRGELVWIPRLLLSGLSFEGVDAQSYDLSALATDGTVGIVVGQDLLSRCLVELEFGRSRFELTPATERASRGIKTIDLTRSPRRLPLLRTSIEGSPATTAILDLGSDVVCSVSRRYADELGLLRGRPVSTALTAGAEGAAESSVLTVRAIALGPYALHDVPVCVIDDWQRSSQIDLGWPFFRAFDMLLDLRHDQLGLRTDAVRLATRFPKDRVGLAAGRTVDHYVVRHVSAGSPADRAGLRVGDEIVGIDGRRIDADWPRRGERQGLRPAGTRLRLELADGRRLEIVLADYF